MAIFPPRLVIAIFPLFILVRGDVSLRDEPVDLAKHSLPQEPHGQVADVYGREDRADDVKDFA